MADAAIMVAQAEAVLRRMLVLAGITEQSPAVLPVWEVCKAFARVPVAHSADHQVLVQWGIYDFYLGRDTFQRDVTRQLDDPESDEYTQIACTLFFEPSADLAPLAGTMWSFDYADLDEFFAAVETLDAFTYIHDGHKPFEVQIHRDKT